MEPIKKTILGSLLICLTTQEKMPCQDLTNTLALMPEERPAGSRPFNCHMGEKL